jgi:hypothetical protein
LSILRNNKNKNVFIFIKAHIIFTRHFNKKKKKSQSHKAH